MNDAQNSTSIDRPEASFDRRRLNPCPCSAGANSSCDWVMGAFGDSLTRPSLIAPDLGISRCADPKVRRKRAGEPLSSPGNLEPEEMKSMGYSTPKPPFDMADFLSRPAKTIPRTLRTAAAAYQARVRA